MTVLLCRQIVETIGKVKCLRISKRFAELLDTPVYVSAIYVDFLDGLTVERCTETQYPVCCRVLRTDIDNKFFGFEYQRRAFFQFAVGCFHDSVRRIIDLFVFQTHRIDCRIGIVIFTERIAYPIVAQKETAHIRVVDKPDTVEVEYFTFIKQRAVPQIGDRVQQRILTIGRFHFHRHTIGMGRRRKVINATQRFTPVHSDDSDQIIEFQFIVVTQELRHSMPFCIGH